MSDFGMINEDNVVMQYLPLNFYFLNIVLLYLYLETIVGRFSWRKHIWWLLPGLMEFAIFSTMSIAHTSFSAAFKSGLLYWHGLLSMLFYIGTSIFIIYKAYGYQSIINETHTGQKSSSIKWIIYICIYFIIYTGLFLIFDSSHTAYIVLSTINVIFIYIIGILGLKQKHIEIDDSTPALDENDTQKSSHSEKSITTTIAANQKEVAVDKESLFEKIESKILSEKHYLDAELNLFKLSRALRVQSRKLSETIHSNTGLNFKKYINKHRIEYAKSLILDQANDNLTMTALAYDAGFQSKSTFYSAFKENVGLTPTEFRSKPR